MRHIILGTAGHIDHGKSSLVKAMTGIDPDRLKEEKERGITIDIGFAELAFPESGLVVGIVDVPGHEKLIRNMLAGAGGIDLVMLVIAADEGIMPQSREHLSICNLLHIKSGLIALTKSDLVEKDWLDLVTEDIKGFVKNTFLEHAPIVPVSSKTGENLDRLKKDIETLGLSVKPKPSGGLFRLPIDRVFTLKGFGTVITGTALSGTISLEDQVEILPAKLRTKVRGLHSHGRQIQTASAGQRVAINLQSVDKDALVRGDTIVVPGFFHETKSLDSFLELLPDAPALKDRSLVHVYVNTSETIARVILYETEELQPGRSCYCQFRLHEPVMAVSGDRYIIRRFSPLETLGGGEIIDPFPVKRKRKDGIDDLVQMYSGDISRKIGLKIEQARSSGIMLDALMGCLNAEQTTIADTIALLKRSGEIMQFGSVLLHRKPFEAIGKTLRGALAAYHKSNPLKQGMDKEEVRAILKIDQDLFAQVLPAFQDIAVEKNIVRLKTFSVALSDSDETIKQTIINLLDKHGFQPPPKEELATTLKMQPRHLSDILTLLSKERSVVRISDVYYISSGTYARMISLLRDFFATHRELTVAEFRDLLSTSRKYALPFLEYLDANNITLRTGDVRKFILRN